jgi:hypothetical protein
LEGLIRSKTTLGRSGTDRHCGTPLMGGSTISGREETVHDPIQFFPAEADAQKHIVSETLQEAKQAHSNRHKKVTSLSKRCCLNVGCHSNAKTHHSDSPPAQSLACATKDISVIFPAAIALTQR